MQQRDTSKRLWPYLLLILVAGTCGCRHTSPPASAGVVPPRPERRSPAETAPPEFSRRYQWPRQERQYQALIERTPAPPGYVRVPLADGT